MLTYILLGLLLVYVGYMYYIGYSGEEAVFTFIGGFFIIPAIVILFASLFLTDLDKTTLELRAVNNTSGTSGSFFLGIGTVKQEQTLNYIYAKDGGNVVSSVKADKAVIFEGGYEPHVVVNNYGVYNEAIFPFGMPMFTTYEFYIPKDSIVESFNIR